MRAYLLLAFFSLAALFAQPAASQTVCHHYVSSGLGIDMEGSPADACAALVTHFQATFPTRSVTGANCATTGTGVIVDIVLQDPSDTFPHDLNYVGACAGDPPASEPEPGTEVAINWSSTTHLLQALLVVACVLVMLNGIAQGNRL